MVVTLIGYRGCGKTTVARLLAQRLAWEHSDADEEVERAAGRTIRAIFDNSGEAEFREQERQVMAQLLSREKLVISAGGGAVLDEGTRRAIKKAGPVVWLTAAAETLWNRIQQDASTSEQRPDLTTGGGRVEVETLLAQRTPLYRECASVTIATDDETAESIVGRILDAVGDEISEGRPSS